MLASCCHTVATVMRCECICHTLSHKSYFIAPRATYVTLSVYYGLLFSSRWVWLLRWGFIAGLRSNDILLSTRLRRKLARSTATSLDTARNPSSFATYASLSMCMQRKAITSGRSGNVERKDQLCCDGQSSGVKDTGCHSRRLCTASSSPAVGLSAVDLN